MPSLPASSRIVLTVLASFVEREARDAGCTVTRPRDGQLAVVAGPWSISVELDHELRAHIRHRSWPRGERDALFTSALPATGALGIWARRHASNVILALASTADVHDLGGKRALQVLVVDDEQVVRDSLARLLLEHEVILTANAAEARELICEATPDVILLDVWMPGLDGLGFLREFERERPELVARVCLMTADPEPLPAVRSPVLVKPFGRQAIREVLALLAPAGDAYGCRSGAGPMHLRPGRQLGVLRRPDQRRVPPVRRLPHRRRLRDRRAEPVSRRAHRVPALQAPAPRRAGASTRPEPAWPAPPTAPRPAGWKAPAPRSTASAPLRGTPTAKPATSAATAASVSCRTTGASRPGTPARPRGGARRTAPAPTPEETAATTAWASATPSAGEAGAATSSRATAGSRTPRTASPRSTASCRAAATRPTSSASTTATRPASPAWSVRRSAGARASPGPASTRACLARSGSPTGTTAARSPPAGTRAPASRARRESASPPSPRAWSRGCRRPTPETACPPGRRPAAIARTWR
ncbi:MAG: response regulator [Proteobacteria bacterium]|nr:response regulator [Pseudomonadota bacterium]MCP4919720.1 response regulator [Pseudomonadota bacterium]